MAQESQPMGPFMVSAPGKVIVFGEHAVVHGKAAMAAALSLRSYLLISPESPSDRRIHLDFPDVKLKHSWKIDDLPWSTFQEPAKSKRYNERVTALDETFVAAMEPHISSVSTGVPETERKVHQLAASSFLYLLLSLLTSSTAYPATYTMRSTIPIGAGLGSSASISVCISSGILTQAGYLQPPSASPSSSDTQREESLTLINNWAYVGELCIHGNPSGVDNTVATRGSAVLFKRPDKTQPPIVTPMQFPLLKLLLVDTKQPRSTLTEVAKVGKLRERHPAAAEHMLEGISQITEEAHRIFSAENSETSVDIESLGELVNMNHGILSGLGVSHPKLEKVRTIVAENNIGWAKLTGAGGGGCAFALLRPDIDHKVLEEVEKRFDQEGFGRYEALLGAKGVSLLSEKYFRGVDGESLLGTISGDRIGELANQPIADMWHAW